MAEHPYEVFNPQGQLVMYSPAECRYPAKIELEMLEAGYIIRLHGKRLTKTEIRKEADRANTRR